MGIALINLVVASEALKVQISGKDKLTKEYNTKIQSYYGRATKDNPSDIQLLKKRIMAIYFNLSSTDKEPKLWAVSLGAWNSESVECSKIR